MTVIDLSIMDCALNRENEPTSDFLEVLTTQMASMKFYKL